MDRESWQPTLPQASKQIPKADSECISLVIGLLKLHCVCKSASRYIVVPLSEKYSDGRDCDLELERKNVGRGQYLKETGQQHDHGH